VQLSSTWSRESPAPSHQPFAYQRLANFALLRILESIGRIYHHLLDFINDKFGRIQINMMATSVWLSSGSPGEELQLASSTRSALATITNKTRPFSLYNVI
jgi:hypothetical protein